MPARNENDGHKSFGGRAEELPSHGRCGGVERSPLFVLSGVALLLNTKPTTSSSTDGGSVIFESTKDAADVSMMTLALRRASHPVRDAAAYLLASVIPSAAATSDAASSFSGGPTIVASLLPSVAEIAEDELRKRYRSVKGAYVQLLRVHTDALAWAATLRHLAVWVMRSHCPEKEAPPPSCGERAVESGILHVGRAALAAAVRSMRDDLACLAVAGLRVNQQRGPFFARLNTLLAAWRHAYLVPPEMDGQRVLTGMDFFWIQVADASLRPVIDLLLREDGAVALPGVAAFVAHLRLVIRDHHSSHHHHVPPPTLVSLSTLENLLLRGNGRP